MKPIDQGFRLVWRIGIHLHKATRFLLCALIAEENPRLVIDSSIAHGDIGIENLVVPRAIASGNLADQNGLVRSSLGNKTITRYEKSILIWYVDSCLMSKWIVFFQNELDGRFRSQNCFEGSVVHGEEWLAMLLVGQ